MSEKSYRILGSSFFFYLAFPVIFLGVPLLSAFAMNGHIPAAETLIGTLTGLYQRFLPGYFDFFSAAPYPYILFFFIGSVIVAATSGGESDKPKHSFKKQLEEELKARKELIFKIEKLKKEIEVVETYSEISRKIKRDSKKLRRHLKKAIRDRSGD